MLDRPCQKNLKKCWQSVPDERSYLHHSFKLNQSDLRIFIHLIDAWDYFIRTDCENETCFCKCSDTRHPSETKVDLEACIIDCIHFSCESFDSFKHYHKPLQLCFVCKYFYSLYTFCSDGLVVRSPLHMFTVWGLSFICFSNINSFKLTYVF